MENAQSKTIRDAGLHRVVGMTLNPGAAYQYWLRQVPEVREWRVVDTLTTRPLARGKKHLLSRMWGYGELPDEDGPVCASWHVYVFAHRGEADAVLPQGDAAGD